MKSAGPSESAVVRQPVMGPAQEHEVLEANLPAVDPVPD